MKEIYEIYSAVLPQSKMALFFNRKVIYYAILMIGRVYANKKSAGLRFLEIDTLFCFLLDFYRNKVILGNCPLLMFMNAENCAIIISEHT